MGWSKEGQEGRVRRGSDFFEDEEKSRGTRPVIRRSVNKKILTFFGEFHTDNNDNSRGVNRMTIVICSVLSDAHSKTKRGSREGIEGKVIRRDSYFFEDEENTRKGFRKGKGPHLRGPPHLRHALVIVTEGRVGLVADCFLKQLLNHRTAERK